MKIVDTGLFHDLALAFIAISLRGLYHWAASCTLIPQPHGSCVPKEGVTEHTKLMRKTWKTKRTTRHFLSSCFHSSPCTCWKEHLLRCKERAGGSLFRLYVYHWNVLGCLTPCVICSCQLHLPLQLSPASYTVYLHCVNQKVLHWCLGNNGRSSQTSGLTSSADVVPLHPGLHCFVRMFPLSPIF